VKKKLKLFIFIDSFGYELIKKYGILNRRFNYKCPLKMQFGYSSTAIPTILTGKLPSEHGQFTFYYLDRENSPFKFFDSFIFKMIPDFINKRRRFRVIISKILKKILKISGYFELYSIPFNKLPFFNYSEKRDLFAVDAFENVENLADILKGRKIPHFISDWRKTEDENFRILKDVVEQGDKEFIFAYFAGLDGVQHNYTKDSLQTKNKLEYYSKNIESIFNAIEKV